MGELNVFSIEYPSLRRLPKTTKLMKNLKTLILVGCRSLESISVVGELVNLDILICRRCYFIECLPIEMAGISRLRLLELSDCWRLKTIAPGIISNQKGLEELIVEDFDNWEAADEESRERKNASLSELEHLSSLTRLKIKIKNSRLAAGHKLPPNMVKYDITIGDHNVMSVNVWGKFKKNALMKLTTLPGNNSLGKWIHECVRIVEYMRLERSDDSSLDFGAAHNMRSLSLTECSAVKKLVNMRSSGATVFPLLERLRLQKLSELEVICDIDGPMQSNSFQNFKELRLFQLPALKHLWNGSISPNQVNIISSFNKLSTIYIYKCDGLRSLFSLSVMARGSWFVQLESLEIEECDMMEQVFLWNGEENQTNIHIPLVFPKLKKLELISLPRLMSFSKGIFQSIDFPLLEKMKVRNCPLLKGSVSSVPSDDHDDVSNIQFFSKVKFDRLTELVVDESVEMGRNWHQFPIYLFAGLCELSVSGFKEMKGLFSLPMAQSGCLLQLEKLEIGDCEIMEQIILWNEEESQRNIHITPFPKLKLLILDSLPRLTSIVEFSLPKKLEIRNCPVLLESCVSTSISPTGPPHDNDDSIHLFCKQNKVGFGNLKELSIRNYDSMRNWCGRISIDFFVVLCELNISKLKGMKSLFPCSIARNLRNLVRLYISDCEEMVKVIEDEEDDALQISLFPNMRRVNLFYLKKLKSFCEWRCTLQLPKLQLLDIRRCDVMDEFTLGALDTPNLKTLRIDCHASGNEVNKALQQRRLKREKELETQLEESSSAEADSTN